MVHGVFKNPLVHKGIFMWTNSNDQPAEVTLNGGLVREMSPNPLNSRLGINTDLSRVMYIIEDLLPLATTKDSKILKHTIHHQTDRLASSGIFSCPR